MINKIQFIIGDGQSFTPLDGTNYMEYNFPDTMLLHKNGYGNLFRGVDYMVDYKNTLILMNGEVFSNGEKYTITY